MVQVEKTFDNPGDDFTCEPPFFSLKKNSLMVMERERERNKDKKIRIKVITKKSIFERKKKEVFYLTTSIEGKK